MVGGLCEDGREPVVAVPVEEDGVDGAGVRDDLDGRVVLRLRAVALADRNLGTPGGAAILRDRERDPRSRAVHAAVPFGVARGEEVDVGGLRVGRDRGLPVVEVRAQRLRTDPAGGRSRRRSDLLAEVPVCPRLGERFEALFRDLGLFLGFGSAAATFFALDLALVRARRSRRSRRSPRARPHGFRRRNGWGGG